MQSPATPDALKDSIGDPFYAGSLLAGGKMRKTRRGGDDRGSTFTLKPKSEDRALGLREILSDIRERADDITVGTGRCQLWLVDRAEIREVRHMRGASTLGVEPVQEISP